MSTSSTSHRTATAPPARQHDERSNDDQRIDEPPASRTARFRQALARASAAARAAHAASVPF